MMNTANTLYLKPGEIHFTRNPAIVTTVLGSCLSITMYNKRSKTAAICHAVMPSPDNSKISGGFKNKFQYVDSSIEWMIEQFKKNGIPPREIEIKMFGGAQMFPDKTKGKFSLAVGKKNIETAMKIFEKKHLRLTAWNIGGNRGRKLIFNTITGDVFAKYVNKTDISLSMDGAD